MSNTYTLKAKLGEITEEHTLESDDIEVFLNGVSIINKAHSETISVSDDEVKVDLPH